ncbi:MFS transporter [Parabacteroides acidifaciens]|uniref:MFS transporter n=1 Tax=Parabacteroides acidifaciens TaxID=2290935 RepID=A0A3D8HB63_9BACT|nr:MFS transporter [Parabacteroides acidifaciens]MBC8603121.1 MFS transporter [Parabacteroides acidifaciens]RDU48178.1 MFS transporter [Parabacteroides acidifaciens]
MKININTSYYKWEVLFLLWIAYFLNQADRQVFNVVLPLIREELMLSDFQIGAISTAFNLVFALCVPFAGYVGDKLSRKWIIIFSIALWSVATMFTGLANGVLMLIFFRSVATGMGEALFGPANYVLLSDYHVETRAFAMSIHQTAYYIGIVISGFLAGYIGQHYGWHNAFYIFGGFGVIHTVVLICRLKDKPMEQKERIVEARDTIPFLDSMKILFKVPTALCLTLGFSALIFGLTGYLTWMPTYLYEQFDMDLADAGFHSMFYTHLFAFIGIILAGRYSDRLAVKNPANRLLMQAIGLLVATPFIVLMGLSSLLPVVYVGFAGFGFARAFFDANTYSVLYDVIPEKYHSSASGVMQMTGFAVGAFAPMILGLLKPVLGLSFGIASLAIVWFVAGILLLIAYKRYFKINT